MVPHGVTTCMAIRARPTDIFRIPVVTVIWSYTGQSTPEIEQRVTTYSELR
jgi:multidrug efflux pump subunit AcrB